MIAHNNGGIHYHWEYRQHKWYIRTGELSNLVNNESDPDNREASPANREYKQEIGVSPSFAFIDSVCSVVGEITYKDFVAAAKPETHVPRRIRIGRVGD